MSCELVQKICEKNNFVLGDRLGSGSFGTTYKANSEYWGDFALKVYDKGSRQDAINEARALAKLKICGKHINVSQLYDYEINDDYSFIASELVKGKNLLEERLSQMGESARIERTFLPMDRKTLIFLFEKISSGLEHIHSAGVIHNDLKLENIMIDENMDPKIIDLGLAGMRGRSAVIYGAPEVVLDNQKPTTRSDVYQLGILFYYLATGHPPFSTGNWREYVDEIVGEKQKQLQRNKRDGLGIKQIRELESNVGKNIAKFIARMIDPDSSKRPKDAKVVHKFFSAKRGFIVTSKQLLLLFPLISLILGYNYHQNNKPDKHTYNTCLFVQYGDETSLNPKQRDIYYAAPYTFANRPLVRTEDDEYNPQWLDDGFLFVRKKVNTPELFFRGFDFEKKLTILNSSHYMLSQNRRFIAYIPYSFDKKNYLTISEIDSKKRLINPKTYFINPLGNLNFNFLGNYYICFNDGKGLAIIKFTNTIVKFMFPKIKSQNKDTEKRLVDDEHAGYPYYVVDDIIGEEFLYYQTLKENEKKGQEAVLRRLDSEGNVLEVSSDNIDSQTLVFQYIQTHFEHENIRIESPHPMPPFH